MLSCRYLRLEKVFNSVLGMNRFVLLLFLLAGGTAAGFAQNEVTLSGIVRDAATGEVLSGAAVRTAGPEGKPVFTNSGGFFSLRMPKGSYEIVISYIGYRSYSQKIKLLEDRRLDASLQPGQALEEVVVTAPAGGKRLETPQMGTASLTISEVNEVPVLFGEKDILKTLQLLPGIKSAGEGNSGFYVRGGSTDQNLLLLDEAPVYNASHLFGFFSAFNSDVVKDVTVYKGGMPAQYGGRLASVVDVKTSEGNKKQFSAAGGLGLIASRLKIEGPLVKDKSSFMISGRRTYADLFLRLSADSTINTSSLYFYDLNIKAGYQLDNRNSIYFSAYNGKDVLGMQDVFNMDWGNTAATLRWNHVFSSRLISNASLIYSSYDYTIKSLERRNDFKVSSGIKDINLKYDFQYYADSRHTLRFGMKAVRHTIVPGKISASEKSGMNDKEMQKRYGAGLELYLSDEVNFNSRLNLMAGLRLSSFLSLGPGTFHTYDKEGNIMSSKTFARGQAAKAYFHPEPRIAVSYLLGNTSSLKASYARNTQSMHLLSNSASTLPTDLWVMSSFNIRPETADQVSAGYYRELNGGKLEFSAEIYYKKMRHQIDYKNAAQLQANENVESELLYGDGRAYGLELFLKKRYGDFNGWIGYTLSRSERRFDEINAGKYFPAKQDRLHDIAAVGIYKLTRRVTLSADFVYGTGNAVTFPSGKYTLSGQTAFYYTERNGYRMPDYHRLDIGASFEGKQREKFNSSWTIGIYNVYNRKNAYTIDFQDDPDKPGQTRAVKTSLFGIIPSVTWNFKF